jgi:hypothetical protein
MVCKAILCRLALLLFTFSGVKSQLFDPPTLGRISNNYFGSRTSYAVKPQPSRQQSNPRHGKPVATDQIGDQETRDMINSFLARESRNSFIGKILYSNPQRLFQLSLVYIVNHVKLRYTGYWQLNSSSRLYR